MKFNNETKVGLLIAGTLILLIAGYNFLKRKDIFDRNPKIYAEFERIGDLTKANEVKINGLTVGEVHEIKETDKHLSRIRVTLSIKPGIKIPANSVAYIKSSFGGLSAASIVIEKGDSTTFLKNRETIKTWEEPEESPVGNFIKGEKIDLPTILRVVANAIDSLQKDSTGK